MSKVVGVRFKEIGKIYYFDASNQSLKVNDMVVAETSQGINCGKVVIIKNELADNNFVKKLKTIIRKAEKSDIERLNGLKRKENKAKRLFEEKIKKHNLNMKLISVEYTFDGRKILFYFTAEGRIDFRGLVKDLAGIFKTRIELRQVGVRDEAKVFGGLGICGKPFCCATFLDDFHPVSIKMAKDQGLSLNPAKISGTCGRLMCCLKFEQEAYCDLLKNMPKVGAIVETERGEGKVIEQNILTGMLKICINSLPEAAPFYVNSKDVKIIRDAKVKISKEEIEKLKELE